MIMSRITGVQIAIDAFDDQLPYSTITYANDSDGNRIITTTTPEGMTSIVTTDASLSY